MPERCCSLYTVRRANAQSAAEYVDAKFAKNIPGNEHCVLALCVLALSAWVRTNRIPGQR